MSRRGAGVARKRSETPELELLVTPGLGRVVSEVARGLIREGMAPPEVSSLFAHVAAHLAQQGENQLSRDEWLTLCAVLWDGPDGEAFVSAPGGQA